MERTALALAACEHGWQTESVHRTSVGTIRYVRCAACDARRVDLDASTGMPPAPITIAVPRSMAKEPIASPTASR